MAADFDGWKIAEQRIAREAEARTGTLDLGGLGLEEIPKAVAGLTHLRELRLGWPHDKEVQGDLGQFFRERRNVIADLGPIACLAALQWLDCSNNRVVDLGPIARLTGLQSLDCSQSDVTDLAPLARLTALQTLNCHRTQVHNLAPLANLTGLRSMVCSMTQVADLAPLANLTSLTWLAFASCKVADLAPVARLTSLQRLYCSSSQVADLAPISGLIALQWLNCSSTQVADLAPIAGLVKLQWLGCSHTGVVDLAPIAGLTALESLDCSVTQVADLSPIARLAALQSLKCSETKITDLAPILRLHDLRSLACGATDIVDLSPLRQLESLRIINGSFLALKSLDAYWTDSGRLDSFVAWQTRTPDIPAGVLSSSWSENCLPSLRAYFEDSSPDDQRLEDVKLMLLGNGRVGKTQLARALRGEPFQPDSRSTHGVTIDKLDLPRGKDPPIPLHIWDFGGQDIYHGTHALFLRDHAIFALVWAREFETASPERQHELFGDRPLRYWVDYVRQAGGEDRAAVVVQTRCDAPRDAAVCPVPEADLRDAFGEFHRVEFSAKTEPPRGLNALREALAEAAAFALEQEGAPKIPAAWARVKAALEKMRAEDRARPEADRRHRVVATEDFEALCRAAGVKSEPKHLLNYLHRSGVVFYRPELMDRIVLDQAWALEAIYAVFEREAGAYKRIRANRGRFTLADLTNTAWRGRRDDERALFLDMMRACGVSFRLDRHGPEDETTRYIAPELLPERANVEAEISRDWDTGQPIRERIYRYKFLHDGLIRALIAGIGDIAGPEAVYWRDGVTVYETTTRARARLEQTTNRDASGAITVQTRGGDAEALLARLCQRVEQTQARLGLEGAPDAPAPPAPPEAKPMGYGRAPDDRFRVYVSYAWADAADPTREQKVDETCAEADKRGFKIIRDKDAMKRGDSISAFMERIGEGDRVYVFLSDKYLKSEFCMYELYAIWRRSGQEKDEFKRRVRLYKLDDAKIGSLRDRLPYANYWDDELKAIRAALQGRDPTLVLGESGAKDYRRLSEFASHVVDILALFADTLQARSFDEFVEYGFEGWPK